MFQMLSVTKTVFPPDAAGGTTAVVFSSLTFTGLTEADARSIESALVEGIAGMITGVSAVDVRRCQVSDNKLSVSFPTILITEPCMLKLVCCVWPISFTTWH